MKVLSIGNSFAGNTNFFMEELMAAARIEGYVKGLVGIGGCSLEKHWNLHEQWLLQKNVRHHGFSRSGKEPLTASIMDALLAETWDVVTFQQASPQSWKAETYEPWLGKLVELVRLHQPQARLAILQTWAYRSDCRLMKQWGITQESMYADITKAVADSASRHDLEIVPVGKAIQAARAAFPYRADCDFDYANPPLLSLPDQKNSFVQGYSWFFGGNDDGRAAFNLDAKHLNDKGCLVAGCTMYQFLTGRSPVDNPFVPMNVDKEMVEALKQVVATVH